MRSLLSLSDLAPTDLAALVERSVRNAADPGGPTLAGRRIGLYFSRASTRTRTAFWAAATLLGAAVVSFGPGELQLATGETMEDTGRILGCYLDALVVRTNGELAEMHSLDRAADLAIVNALSSCEHPTQAVADLATVRERFGGLVGCHVLYVGEGNSTATALAYACALTPGLLLTVVSPPGYGLPGTALKTAEILGAAGRVRHLHDLGMVSGSVDCVYTSRWQTMGVAKKDPGWIARFQPYQVDAQLMERVSHEGTVFLHDLPAVRGQEVAADVLDGPRSLAYRQAYHKMTAAMAVLEWCLVGL